MKRVPAFLFAVLILPLVMHAQDKATASLSIMVNPAVVAISPSTLPEGMVGTIYGGAGTTIAASGGLAPYTFSVSTGSLPAGLALSGTTGAITGTPTASGSSTFTVKVSDSETIPATATQSYTVTILSALSITNTSLPAANIGIAYTATLTASGGQNPYTFSISSGSLPSGLTLNATTGVISGTPTSAGTFNFVITVTDSASNVAQVIGQSVIVASARVHRKKVA